MANRTVSVALKLLIGDYVGSAEKASQSTDKIGDSATRTAAQHGAGMKAITAGAGIAAAAGALGLGKIISASMGFEKAMSGVEAVSGAAAGEMDKLRAAALQAGADTAFSASQAAEAEAELAKAGVSTADILGGALRGSLDLAAAGQLDLGNAATIAAQAMNIFELKGADVASIADTLAAGANKSAADVDQLAQALAQGGQVAASMGLDLQDTVGAFSMFADAGLKGSDAGTSLKTALQMLVNPTAQAAGVMEDLGIRAFDTAGNFVGMEDLAGQLQTRLGGLTQEQRGAALATIFGSDAVRAANVLYKQGAAGVAEYTAAVDDQGAAGRMAAVQLDNLAGDVEALGGSIETALIKGGSGANGMLRGLTQTATGAVNVFADLPAPVQAGAVALLAVGTAGVAAVAGLGTVVPKIREGREALREMGTAGERTDKVLGKVGKGLVVGGAALAGLETAGLLMRKLQDASFDALPGVEEVKSSLLGLDVVDRLSGKLPGLGEDLEFLGAQVQRLADPSLGDQVGKVFASVFTAGQADPAKLRDATQNLQAIDEALSGLVSSGNGEVAARAFGQLSEAAVAGGASVEQLRSQLPQYRDALAGVNNETKLAADGTRTVGAAAADAEPPMSAMERAARALGVELKDTTTAADLAKTAIDRLNGVNLTALETDINFRDSLVGVTEAVKDNGRSLDLNATKGRANISAVADAIKAASQHGQAVADQTGSVDKGTTAFGVHVEQLRRTAIAAGLPRGQVNALIAAYGKVPKAVETGVSAPGAAGSKAAIDGHNTAAGNTPKARATQVSAPGAGTAAGKMNRATQAANGIPARKLTVAEARDEVTAKVTRINAAIQTITPTKHVYVQVTSSGIQNVQREINSITGHAVSIQVGRVGVGPQGRASGGPVEAGTIYRVNESGAEGYFVPPRDGYIINNQDMKALAAAAPTPGLNSRVLQPAGAVSGPSVTIAPGALQLSLVGVPGMTPAQVGSMVDGALRTFADRVAVQARKGDRA